MTWLASFWCLYSLCEMCSNTGFFLVRIFPHWDWIRRDTSYLSVFSPNAGKYRPEKTLYLDTFHAVIVNFEACNFIKKSLQHRCFDVNIAKFLRTTFFIEHLQWLLLMFAKLHDNVHMNILYLSLVNSNKKARLGLVHLWHPQKMTNF